MKLKSLLLEQLLNEFSTGAVYDYNVSSKDCYSTSYYKFKTDGKETEGKIYNFLVVVKYVDHNNFPNTIEISFSTDEHLTDDINAGLKELIKIMSTVAYIVKQHIKDCNEEGVLINSLKYFAMYGKKENYGQNNARKKIYKRAILQHIPDAVFVNNPGSVVVNFDPAKLK
jgi:hypothetical protein